MAKKLAKVLCKCREDLGLGYRAASRQTGVDFGYIRRIELGEIVPGIDILEKLAKGYDSTVLTILRKAGYK